MARKRKKTSARRADGRESQGKTVAALGLGAMLVGVLTWLTGGFTRENGIEWLKMFLIAGTLALFIRWSIGEPFKIPSGSMKPTLHGDKRFLRGDRLFVNKSVYGLRFPFNGARIPFADIRIKYAASRIWRGAEPQRFDIVVFRAVEEGAAHAILVKRVIGLPDERIHIAGGQVYVNGEPLELPAGMPPVAYTSHDFAGRPIARYGILEDDAHAVVPEDCYLLLGDNSAHSRDGRFFGWVPNENILGRVSCIWWPVGHWRDFTGFSHAWWWRGLVGLLGVLLFVRLFLGRSWRVHEEALKDSLVKGDHVYVNRRAFGPPIPFTGLRFFHGRGPRRGEIVVYHGPAGPQGEAQTLLGRVAGMPGEQVFLDGGKLQINGAAVTAPRSLADTEFHPGKNGGQYARSRTKQYSLVPDNNYFILADNPDESPDSRTLGWVPRRNLMGPVSAVWWPPKRWCRLRQ